VLAQTARRSANAERDDDDQQATQEKKMRTDEAIKRLRERGIDAMNERWHVCWWTTGRGRNKREGYHVKCESDRNKSGTPIACFSFRSTAQRCAEEHNDELIIKRLQQQS
jgi:hypothetical protein